MHITRRDLIYTITLTRRLVKPGSSFSEGILEWSYKFLYAIHAVNFYSILAKEKS